MAEILRWAGGIVATVYECPVCAEQFSALVAFDRHQEVDYSQPRAVHCRKPAAAGLVRNGRGLWRIPDRPGKAPDPRWAHTRTEKETMLNMPCGWPA